MNARIQSAKRAAQRTRPFLLFGGILAVFLLISAQRIAEKRLSEMHALGERIQNAMDAREVFFANVSHELRTPLHSILGMAASLKDPLTAQEKAQCHGVLDRSCVSLLGLIDDILDLSKMDADKLEVFPRPFDLRETVEGCVLVASYRARQRGIGLVCEFADDFPKYFLGDAKRIGQILTNLLSNAIKFTPEGRVTLRVRRSLDHGPFAVRFEIEDTGIGIAEGKLGSLFEKYNQIDARISLEYGGTGLGLTIVKQLVNVMKGVIFVKSEAGKGSQFCVQLPLPVAKLNPAETLAAAAGNEIRPLRVLIADDVDDNRTLIHFYLKGLPFELSFARDGAEALRFATEEIFDAVLLDIHMPQMNGYEVIQGLRSHERARGKARTPVITMTAQGSGPIDNTEIENGAVFHLSKPASKEVVIETLLKHASANSDLALGRAHLPDSLVYLNNGMKALVPSFLENRRKDVVALKSAFFMNDDERIARLCHTFRGVTSSFGFFRASELCEEIQTAHENNQTQKVEALLTELEGFYNHVKVTFI